MLDQRLQCRKGDAGAQEQALDGRRKSVLDLLGPASGLPCPGLWTWRLGGGRAVLVPGPCRGLAIGTDQLHRTLRSDPPPPGRGQIRTCPAASFVERVAKGVELAAVQSATPFRSSLQTRPAVSPPADLFRG